MNFDELLTYNLADAVKFHNRLNPRLWGQDEHLLPEVQQKLLEIAADFQEFLGVNDIDVVDITISGSNAAYSYTPHSDIDLHLVVRTPEGADDVYQELFNAKKYQYNDEHDIRIHGADVELYVQPADEPPVSLGEYSVRDGKWIQVPKRKRAKIDQSVVRHKYEDLKARIENAVNDNNADRISALIAKIKEMRQAGLDEHGEFGPENIAYKVLRTQGLIQKLYDARNAARDRELSLMEKSKQKKKFKYGSFGGWFFPGYNFNAGETGDAGGGDAGSESFREDNTGMAQGGLDGDPGADSTWDGVSPDTDEFLSEDDVNQSVLRDFIRDTAKELGIKRMPRIHVHNDAEWSEREKSFGRYVPETHDLHINMYNRHIMDVLRTTAHELAHCRQHEVEKLGPDAGDTGSDMENEAHAVAGIIMRNWAKRHPDMFESSGYIPTEREKNDPRFKMALSVDVRPGATGLNANKMSLKTDKQGKPALLMRTANLRESRMPQPSQGPGKYRDLNKPLGPETPPTMPKGTVKVDVSDMYDWYKLGQHIANLKGLGHHDFGAGPPSTIVSFGDEETEHKYIQDLEKTGLTTTDVDPKDPNQPPGMPRQKVDPTYNVSEAFDQPYPIQWEESDYGDIDALAKLDDGSYLSIMFNNSGLDSWTVEFHRNNSQEVTGEGDAPRVFATVLTAIQQFIQEYNPHIVYFSAVKDQDPKGSRAKLYDRLVQRYASQLGYAVKRTTRDDEVGYNLVRIRQNVAENDIVESLRREFSLLEDEYISEVRMSTSNLRQLAAKTGARAGMEFEMIVPNAEAEPPEPEYERDEDQDRRARSFDDVEEFFYDGDYNSRGDVRSLLNELSEAYQEWKMDRTASDWDDEGLDYLRDYIENYDLFDRDEALDTARDEFADANPDIPLDSEEAQRGISARVVELQEQFVQDEFESQGRIYNDAFTEFADEKNQDYDESDFLEETFPYMSDIERNFDIQWPYYYDINDGQGGEASVDDVANEFEEAIGRPVNASSSYHGARREAGHYVVEPDGSLDPDHAGDAGLEFVSPPLPIDELLSDLNKVKEWAGSRGCYTNDSTGLHINISVPDYSLEKLDYVKLALLMGDEYVLELFGRSGNHYAKAATGKIRDALRKNPDLAPMLMDKMRDHMEDLATKAIHSGITDKYTSINTKTGYIEFRSPGGDWLDENFDKIENTLLRFTVALSAAIDPQAYRKEYLKKLYKLLEGAQDKGGVDVLQLFANYSSGELDKAALIRQVREKQLARNLEKGKVPAGQKYWWSVTNPANTFASIEVVATSKEEAIEKAVEPGNYPEWARVQNTLRAKPLRPYQEPTKSQQVAQQQSSGPTLNGRPSNPGGNYIIYNAETPGNMIPAYRFMAADQNDALVVLGQWRRANPGVWDVAQDTHQSAGQPAAQQQTPSQSEGNWGFWITSLGRFARAPGQSDNNVLRRFPSREAAEQYRANTPGIRSDIEIREIPTPGSTIDRAMQRAATAQNANYEIYDTRTGTRLEAFHAESNAAALSHLEAYRSMGPHNLSPDEAQARYKVRPIDDTPEFVDTTTQSNRGDLTPHGPGPWEIYRLSDNQAVRSLEHTSRPAAESEARSALGLRGWDPTEYGVRTRQQTAAANYRGPWEIVRMEDGRVMGTIASGNHAEAEVDMERRVRNAGLDADQYDIRPAQQAAAQPGDIVAPGLGEPATPRTLTTPGQPQQTFTGQWDVVLGGEVVFRVPGENQSIANQAARQWILGRSPEFLRAHQGQEVEVVPRYS